MAKRRANGEGGIYKRADGRWCAQISLEGRRLTYYSKKQQACIEWLQKTREQIAGGMTLKGAQSSLSEYLQAWLGSVKTSLRPKTWAQYEQIARLHIVPYIGKIKLKDLRPDHIQGLYTAKMNEGASRTTVRLVHAVLHRALVQAVKWGILGRNPADAVNKPKPARKEMTVLNDDQVRALLSVVEGTKFAALYYLAVTTGLRMGELLGLKWGDLDWNTGRLRLQRQLQRSPEEGIMFSEPKTQAGRRVVALGAVAVEKLRKHNELQHQERKFAGERWKENVLIFPSSIGTPMDPRNLLKHLKQMLKEAGLPDIRFHDLRHTAATLMLLQGIHPKVVQERLGHSNISLTLDTYSHVLPSMQEDAALALDQLLVPIAVKLQ